jgi:hypothetical protein
LFKLQQLSPGIYQIDLDKGGEITNVRLKQDLTHLRPATGGFHHRGERRRRKHDMKCS